MDEKQDIKANPNLVIALGYYIRNKRLQKNIGLREMAELLHISPAYLSNLESGKHSMTNPLLLKKISKILNVDHLKLFKIIGYTDKDMSDLKKEIITTVKNASKVNVKLLSLKKSGAHNAMVNKVDTVAKNNRISSGNSTLVKNIVTIGTSTGGPRALHEVIPNISGKINAPVLIVQHMPKGFTKSLADRLNMVSQLSVKEAEDGEILQNGFAYIAPGDKHLKIKSAGVDKYAVYLDGGDAINGHRPAVDAMMYSIADNPIKNVIAVVMTGMGNDGAKGLEKLKLVKNAKTISEDEKTCVVYGMPKAAAETGKVDMVVPLNNIANEINKLMGV